MHTYPLFNGRRTQTTSEGKMKKETAALVFGWEHTGEGAWGALPAAVIGTDPGHAVARGCFSAHFYHLS